MPRTRLKMIFATLLISVCGCEEVVIEEGEDAQVWRPQQTRPVVEEPRPFQPGCNDPYRCPAPQPTRATAMTGWAVPYCDLPAAYRVRNYAGGSCVHASMETILHWQGQHELAQWWRANYAGGEYTDRLHRRLDEAGVRFAFTTSRSAEGWEFLRKCCALRLACAVNLPQGHMQTLVGMDERAMYVIDNNGPGTIDVWTHAEFARMWTGWAVTVVGQAPPPEPWL